ncbi:MAG TPA: SIMPL domain-containing protein [Kofleriaceae bacterium]|nr:SIMPL domain-containing protein [Kofleriaceae bacterium]
MYVNQSISRPQGVNAFGTCLLRAAPDHVSVRFAVNRVSAHPRDAFAAVRTAARAVRDCVRALGVADADVAASETTLADAHEGDYQHRRKVGYQGSVQFHAIVRDLAALEPLLVAIVDAGADTIVSVHPRTSRLRELRAQARANAVRSARAKAEALASAAGASLGAVLHLEDVNPDEMSRRSHAPDIDLTEHDQEAEAATAHDPGAITIAAAVMACFALTR